MTYIKKLMLSTLVLLMSQASLASECLSVGSVVFTFGAVTTDTNGNPSDITGYTILYRASGDEANSSIEVVGQVVGEGRCNVELPLPNVIVASAYATNTGGNSADTRVYRFVIGDDTIDPELPPAGDIVLPPAGVKMGLLVPDGFTVRVEVIAN